MFVFAASDHLAGPEFLEGVEFVCLGLAVVWSYLSDILPTSELPDSVSGFRKTRRQSLQLAARRDYRLAGPLSQDS